MGLLSRRRRTRATDRADPLSGTGGSGSDQPAAPASTGQPTVTASGGDLSQSGGPIIRAEDLAQPAWTGSRLPRPLLPPMPFVVARNLRAGPGLVAGSRSYLSPLWPTPCPTPARRAWSRRWWSPRPPAPGAPQRGSRPEPPGRRVTLGVARAVLVKRIRVPSIPPARSPRRPGGPAVASAPWPGSSLPDLTLFGAPGESASTGDPTGGSTWFHSTQPDGSVNGGGDLSARAGRRRGNPARFLPAN